MSSEMYRSAIFQLADLWTNSLEPAEYVTFLMDLLEKMKKAGLGNGLLEGKDSGPPRNNFLRKGSGEKLRLAEKFQGFPPAPSRRTRRQSIESFLPPSSRKPAAGSKLQPIPAGSLPTIPPIDA